MLQLGSLTPVTTIFSAVFNFHSSFTAVTEYVTQLKCFHLLPIFKCIYIKDLQCILSATKGKMKGIALFHPLRYPSLKLFAILSNLVAQPLSWVVFKS